MKRLSPLLAAEIALVLAATLSGCAEMRRGPSEIDPMSGGGMEGVTEAGPMPSSGPFYNQGGIGQTGTADLQTMCSMYRNMANARTPEERQAMMDQHMRQMSPEMQQRHMQMMGERCKQ
jgi:hypothetical protein